MNIKYLGTAAAEGLPALFCNCKICTEARKRGGKNIRTRSQALIDNKILIDFNADTYMHTINGNVELSKINHCLVTHAHEDHLYVNDLAYRIPGFSNLGNEKPFKLYGTYGVVTKMADYNTGEITVSGELSDPVKYDSIAAVVTDTDTEVKDLSGNNIKWIGQTSVDKIGKWSFSFKLTDVDGEYKYIMQALSLTENIQKEFSFGNIIPTMTVKKGETLIDDFSQLGVGDTLDVTVGDLDNNNIQNRKVIVAQYDQYGKLLIINTNETPAASKGKSFSIAAKATVLNDTSTIKIFYWDVDTFVPFMGVYVID